MEHFPLTTFLGIRKITHTRHGYIKMPELNSGFGVGNFPEFGSILENKV
jgi:hypothetical protein